MTTLVQDFDVVAGDDASPLFTITDGAGNAIPLSGVQEITWLCTETITGPALITKTKTSGSITFPGGGNDGVLQVNLTATDTQPLAGYYFHKVKIRDSGGKNATVELGTMHMRRSLANV